MKKCFIFLIVMGLFLFKGFSQSAERISVLIEEQSITNAQASYLAASYLGLIQDEDSDSDAFNKLLDSGYFKSGEVENSLITYSTLAYIYTKALDIKGGLFYSLFPSKRYAFNELKAQGIIPANCDPSDKVTGRDSITVFSLCTELKEGQ